MYCKIKRKRGPQMSGELREDEKEGRWGRWEGGGGRASEMGILHWKPTNKTSTTDIIRTLVGIFLCKNNFKK